MTTPTHLSRRSLLGIAGASAGALALGACGDDGSSGNSGAAGPSTIEWWHIQNTAPMLDVWAQMGKDYQASHSGVTVNITPIVNEQFKARLTTVTQAGDPPDVFHTWGGGVLKQQADAGLVKDLTADITPILNTFTATAIDPYRLDGKIYGVPFDAGMIGFWYNKKLFTQAGITGTPTTWNELLEAVRKLKAAGITPISLAGGHKWPGHYYWSYLSLRVGGSDILKRTESDKNFDKPEFVEAGRLLKQLVDLAPFQSGFLGAEYEGPDGQAATMGNSKAAMELMGQWAPSVQEAQSGKKLGADLGFFPFPTVEGGKGKVTDAFGGGGGFAIGKNAPAATVDFVKFLVNVDNQRKAAATNSVLPIAKGAEDALTDPNQKLVAQTLANATAYQLYVDQAFPPAVGQQVNDSTAELIAGKASPEQVVKAVTDVAKRQ